MRYHAAVMCHIGHIRKNNEDNYYCNGKVRQDLNEPVTAACARGSVKKALFAVADGMGGGANGEIASSYTVANLQPAALSQVQPRAQASIRAANEQICSHIRKTACGSMGSTLAALYLDGNTAVGCNVGDSRIYLYRSHQLRQISIDHTTAQMLVNMGALTPEQARTHPGRRVLRQHIGIFEEELTIAPSFTDPIPLQHGDIFLLCSDGLTDMVTDEQISRILDGGGAAGELAEALIQQALEQGGRDNVTALVIKIQNSTWLGLARPEKRCRHGV